MTHLRQSKMWDCGATCYQMIVGCDDKTARKECQTKSSGTNTFNVKSALEKRGYNVILINVENDYRCVQTHLKLLSHDYFVYCSCLFVSNSGRGRDSKRYHAVLIKDEEFADPSESFSLDLAATEHIYNKRLIIRNILLVSKVE